MNMKKMLFLAVTLLLIAPLAHAQLGTTTIAPTVSVNVTNEAALKIVDSNTPLTSVGTNFSNYTGTTNYLYYVRTTTGSGSGTIVLQITTDFAPVGGPSVGTPPSAGDALTYVPSISSPGTAASVQTAATASTTPVASFGAGAHSTKAGNAASLAWTLTNDPVYGTGSYTATVTLTIASA
jgi:hypothetical protein